MNNPKKNSKKNDKKDLKKSKTNKISNKNKHKQKNDVQNSSKNKKNKTTKKTNKKTRKANKTNVNKVKNDSNVRKSNTISKSNNHKFGFNVYFICFLLILIVAFSYSLFNYNYTSNNTKSITGELYLHYVSGNTIRLNNMLPRDNYDELSYFEFSVSGKNTSLKDVLYEINLSYGENINDKIRLDDRFLKFRLVEVNDNTEMEIFNNVSYPNINNTTIHVEGIEKNTYEEINKTYRLYVWINGVLIGNTEHADYTSEEWVNTYSNIKVNVRANSNTNTYIINYHPNRLSEEYQEVEYIESFGNEYIITDIIPSNEMGISMKFASSNIVTEQVLIGSSNFDNSNFLIGNMEKKMYYGWDLLRKNTLESFSFKNDIINSFQLNYLNNRTINLNDNILVSNLDNISLNNTNPISIFALNKNGNITLNSSIKLYELKISLNDDIKYDFVPCYRKSDNKVGLYEIMTGKFYNNSGTGEFIKGENKILVQNMINDSLLQLKDNSFLNKYEFYKWNTSPDASGESYNANQLVKNLGQNGEIINLYAIWSNRLIIENIEVIESNFSTININSYEKTNFNSSIELANDYNKEDANVVLSITFSNNSPYIYSFSDVDFSGNQNYDNENIIFDIIGLNNGDIIESGEKLTFKLKFRYKNIENITNNKLNCKLNFMFNNLSGIKLDKLIISNEANNISKEDGLYLYNDKHYFSGVNVNNYIWFNCKDGYNSGSDYCEKWRILSIDELGNVKIIKDNVLEKEKIEQFEKETSFWLNNTSKWMTDTKVLAEGRILFDIKERRPGDKSLQNSYCISTSNGCNAFTATNNTTGFYKNLNVDLDSLAKKYLDNIYYLYGLNEENRNQIMIYPRNVGLVSPSLSMENILKSEESIKINAYVSLLNVSDYLYANTNTSCWYDFSKCTNNSSNNWLTLPDNPYYLVNGKIVSSVTGEDKNAQVWTVKSNGLVSHDANNEYYLRPVVVLKNDVKAIGLGTDSEYYTLVS